MTDGSPSGTVLVKDLNLDGDGVLSQEMTSPDNILAVVGSTLYFWGTDGTDQGYYKYHCNILDFGQLI